MFCYDTSMSFQGIAAAISVVLAVYCTIPYVVGVIKGKTKPHQLNWLVFVIMNAIVFISQFLEGGRASTLIALAYTIGSVVIFGLSFKYGTRDTSRWDRLLFAFAIVTIIIWVFTKSNEIAIWLTVLIDLAASTMIILKMRTVPNSEAAQPWAIATVAYVFSCLSLIGTPINILYVRPVYGLLCDLAIVLAILHYRKRGKPAESTAPAEI